MDRKSKVQFCDLDPEAACCVINAAHPLTELNISPKFYENIAGVKGIWNGHRSKGSKFRA